MKHYVYRHVCPVTYETIYIGHGCGARAWMYDVPFRAADHAEYLNEMVGLGFLPSDWVEILARGLGKNAAYLLEQNYIEQQKPRFNKTAGPALLKVTHEMLKLAQTLREQHNMSYENIAKALNVSTMTIHRAINGKTKSLEDIIERTT